MNTRSAVPAPRQEASGRLVHVVQGDYAVTSGEEVILTTILGSCVAACIRDPLTGVGGMNHFLLPGDEHSGDGMKYGVHSMELLINALLQRGAARARLEAKLFGGACVVQGLSSDVGKQNARFATEFLRQENIPCVGQSLGGSQARRIRYWPTSGRAAAHFLPPTDILASELRAAAKPKIPAGEVELF